MLYQPLNKGLISPRTGKNTVALVGFAASTRHLVPYEDEATEIWGINDAYRVENFMKRWDRWFQLHTLEYLATQDSSPRDAEHLNWLKEPHDFPIYMQKEFPDMPASVEYPLDDVMARIGRPYITSSFGFLFGLAMLEGFERIEVYGFDMKTFTEYAEQRPNTEYLIGKAEGEGIEVYIPSLSTLCRGPIYGYQNLDLSFRQELEYYQLNYEAEIAKQTNMFHETNGKIEVLKEVMKENPEMKEKLQPKLQELSNQATEIEAVVNNTMGREQVTRQYMAMYDELKEKEIKLQESENARKKQEATVRPQS